MYCECRTLRFFCHTLPCFPQAPRCRSAPEPGPDGGENSSLRVPSGTLTDEKKRAAASGALQSKLQSSSAERHRDRRSHAPEPPPATGATSTSSVLPALAPGRHLTQPQNVQQYRASPGVAVARALLWSAVVLLTDWLQPNSRPEKLLRRCPYSVPRSLTARLGKSFPINSSFIGVISS